MSVAINLPGNFAAKVAEVAARTPRPALAEIINSQIPRCKALNRNYQRWGISDYPNAISRLYAGDFSSLQVQIDRAMKEPHKELKAYNYNTRTGEVTPTPNKKHKGPNNGI